MKRKKHIPRTAVWLLALVAAIAMGVSGYMLWESQKEYVEGNTSYELLAQQVGRVSARVPAGTPKDTLERVPQVEIPDIGIDFDALKAVSEDCIGWLYCPDTVIDYPVMRSDDYNYYLTHLPDGSKNKNGALFLDYNCRADFSDAMSIIYGHNMKSGRMFGSLTGYKQQSYYQKHPYMYLYTRQGNYRIDLLYGFVVASREWSKNRFMYQESSEKLLEYAAANTTFDSSAMRKQGDRFVTLSTCSYEFNDARYALIGILVPEYAGQG